jgi:hypothetical protein
MTGEPPESDDPVVSDGALLGLLVLDGVLLGGFGLVFTPLYTNGVPARSTRVPRRSERR